MKSLLLVATFAISFGARADLLTLTKSGATNTGVALSSGAVVTATKLPLTTVGAALRQKQILVNQNIYVGQLLVAEPNTYKKTVQGALPSLDTESAVALVMNFLFSPPTFLVTQDFNAAAAANNISSNDPDIQAFMSIISPLSFRDGGQLTLLFVKNADGSQTLQVEDKLNS